MTKKLIAAMAIAPMIMAVTLVGQADADCHKPPPPSYSTLTHSLINWLEATNSELPPEELRCELLLPLMEADNIDYALPMWNACDDGSTASY